LRSFTDAGVGKSYVASSLKSPTFTDQPYESRHRTHRRENSFKQTLKEIGFRQITFGKLIDFINERANLLPRFFDRAWIDATHSGSPPRDSVVGGSRLLWNDSSLNVGLKQTKSLLVTVDCHRKCRSKTFGCEKVDDNSLRKLNCFWRGATDLLIKAEVNDQLLRSSGHAAKVGIVGNDVGFINWHLHLLGSSRGAGLWGIRLARHRSLLKESENKQHGQTHSQVLRIEVEFVRSGEVLFFEKSIFLLVGGLLRGTKADLY
jgi:hypothetical protein